MQSNYSATSNYEVGTLAVDVWAVTFGTAMRGLGGAAARLGLFSLYVRVLKKKMYSPYNGSNLK